jgi:dihydroorotase
MTLYLSPSLTPAEIQQAAKQGISGVKSYPRGVTTGSDQGVESYERYYDVFEEMERQDLVLNLHGEVPSNPKDVRPLLSRSFESSKRKQGTTVLNAEPRFLSHLISLHSRFPRLRIVLEHATTQEAIQTVLALGPTVSCSITAHHLLLTIDDWAGQPLHYCKPVAKSYEDRTALRQALISGNPKFFLGSDSAPHPFRNKMPSLPLTAQGEVEKACSACAAGVYTSPYLLPIIAHAFEAVEPVIPLDRLEDYVSNNGRAFYRVQAEEGRFVTLRRSQGKVERAFRLGGEDYVIPYKAGEAIGWEVVRD